MTTTPTASPPKHMTPAEDADPTAVVLDDVRIAWDVPELKAHGPDIMVIFGVKERKNWSTFDIASEGVRPALIIKVTSPETDGADRSTKLEEYDLAEVPLYIIVDSGQRRGQAFLRLLGYRHTAVTYEVLPPDERGWLWLEPLRLWFGIRDNEIYCYDEDSTQLGDYVTVVEELTSERRARNDAENRAAEAGGQAEAERHARTEAQAASARQARAEAETRLRDLEAEVRQLRGEA